MDEAKLQEMWDHHEIRQLLATYCHGCDRADEREMASVYAEESWDDHGNNKCDGKEFTYLILAEARVTTRVLSHQLGQSLIQSKGESAAAETYFVATLISDTDDGESMSQLGGRYVDTLIKEEGAWRIKERLCVLDWSTMKLNDPGHHGAMGFIPGQRGALDVSWEKLGLQPQDA